MPLTKPYSFGGYNKFDANEQWIRISEGCPNGCPYCYEPKELKVFNWRGIIGSLIRNLVKIMDMNLLCKPEALEIIKELGLHKVNGKVIYYELICGIDYRFLTPEIAEALYKSRFKNIRLAWDWQFNKQYKIKEAIGMLVKAGYSFKDIMIFMVCNWKITYAENLRKMDLCKVWNVQIADCWFDNQISPNIKPIHWTAEQIKDFRRRVRKHNQLVNFKIDPEVPSCEASQMDLIEL